MTERSTGMIATALLLGALWTVAAPVGAQLDNYHCYKVKDRKTPKFLKTTVDLGDVFTTGVESVEVKKPFLFCVPTDANGSGINDASARLCCYKTKGPKFPKAIRPSASTDGSTTQQDIDVDILKSFVFCEPCSAVIAIP